tara:strand:+ start:2964 stop:4064 length:1101 start_codon:yes stop_codon:yes gene_type:complete
MLALRIHYINLDLQVQDQFIMVKKVVKVISLVFVLLCSSLSSFGQYSSNPCSIDGVYCTDNTEKNGVIYSFYGDTFKYPAPGTSMPFWMAVGDVASRTIDTTFVSSVIATVLSGPGLLHGPSAQNISKYSHFNDWKFTVSGVYEIEFSIAGLFKDTVFFEVAEEVDFCAKVPAGCTDGGGDLVYPSTGNGGIIPVDAIFPITVGVVNSLTGQLDSSFFGYVFLEKLSGPGNMYGTLNMYGGRWLTFTDVRFDEEGTYLVEISTSLGYTRDTVSVDVYTPTESIHTPNYSSLSIFPNPFSDNVTIKFDDGERIDEINIINSQGKLVERYSSISSSTLDLSHLPKGVYFIEAISLIGLKSEVSILVKK